MPDLQFVLPHWLYWTGLIAFPLAAMVLVRRRRRLGSERRVSLPVGYLLLVTAGFAGIHRFYVRNWRGALYIPVFIGIMVANIQARDARETVSLANSDVMVAEFDLEDAERAGDPAPLEAARGLLTAAQGRLDAARGTMEGWSRAARTLALIIALFLLIDAVLLPRLVRRCADREGSKAVDIEAQEDAGAAAGAKPAATRALERLSRLSGEFVCYWSVLAVFAYYYEVLARYIFNSPTNWVHESMFLMFGMMYLIAGAYAYMTDSHVRVDIFYARLSPRGKAITDLLTSVFFFIFAGTLLATGWIFMMDSVGVSEVSFTEWAIQYWPVKVTIVIGAALIALQGIAKLIADLSVVLARPA